MNGTFSIELAHLHRQELLQYAAGRPSARRATRTWSLRRRLRVRRESIPSMVLASSARLAPAGCSPH